MNLAKPATSFFLTFALFLLSACNAPAYPGGTPRSSASDSSISIQETSNRTSTAIEMIPINNCGGKAESKQTAERFFVVNVEGSIGATVGIPTIQANISAKYGLSKGISKKMELSAPPGTNMQFVLKWTEQEWVGIVLGSGQTGTYNARSPIAVEQVSATDLGCGTVTNSIASSSRTSSPTSASTTAQSAALPVRLPDLIVPSNTEIGVVFTATQDGTYRFTIDRGTKYCTMGGLCRSIVHGFLGRNIVWGPSSGFIQPINEDYLLGCWEDGNCSGLSVSANLKTQQTIRWVTRDERGTYGDNAGNIVLTVERFP